MSSFQYKTNYFILSAGLIVLGVLVLIDTKLVSSVYNNMVDFELAKTYHNSQQILSLWTPEQKILAAFSLGIDYLFLSLYTLFFVRLTLLISERNTLSIIKKQSKFIIILFVFAGLCDMLENYNLLKILLGSKQQTLPYYSYIFASLKFSGILIGIIFLLIGFFVKKRKKSR